MSTPSGRFLASAVCFLFFIAFNGNILLAQNPLAKRLPEFDYWGNLVVAKNLDPKSEDVTVLIPTWTVTKEMRRIQVTNHVAEERSRSIDLGGGKSKMETYIVQVPFFEFRDAEVEVLKPGESSRVVLPLKAFKAWTAKGKSISEDEFKNHLQKSIYLLVLPEEPRADETPIDPFYAAAIGENVFLVFCPQLVKALAESSPPLPAATTP